MGLFRRALYLLSVAGIIYGGIQVKITEKTLASSLVPFLILWVMVDVPHYLTLGLLDLSNALFVIFKRTSISLPDLYRGFVLPIDVDDSGMMKQDKYTRNGAYAIRKLWLKTGLEKELASAGFSIEFASRSLVVKDSLGLFDRYRIRSQIVAIRDELDSFFVEQKFLSGIENHEHAISYVQFKIVDNNAHLRRPGASKITVSKVFAHGLTRRMSPPKRGASIRSKSKVSAKSEEAEKVIAEIAGMCMEEGVKVELMRYISHCCGVDQLSSPQTPASSSSSSDGTCTGISRPPTNKFRDEIPTPEPKKDK